MKIDKLPIIFTVLFVLALGTGLTIILLPVYKDHILKRHMTAMTSEMAELIQASITHVNLHGTFPNKSQLSLNEGKYAYDFTMWASNPLNAETVMGQTSVIQGGINGLAIGLDPGHGGMFTCLLANREGSVKTKCFYQVKHM